MKCGYRSKKYKMNNYIYKLSNMKVRHISIPFIKGKYFKDYRNAIYRSTRNSYNMFSLECVLADDSFFEESKLDDSIFFYENEKLDEEIKSNEKEFHWRDAHWHYSFTCVGKHINEDGTFSAEFHRERAGVDGNTIYSKMSLTGEGDCKFITGKEYAVVY